MKRGERGLIPGLFLLLFLQLSLPAWATNLSGINRHILALTPLMTDPLSLSPTMEKGVLMILLEGAEIPGRERLYFADGTSVPPTFFQELKKNMALDQIPQEIRLVPALVVRPTLSRELPTEEALFKSPQEARERAIDLNISTAIPPGTPLVIAHTSRDGLWAFILSTYNPGWVPIQDLVTTTWEEMRAYATHTPFAVITVAHCPVFSSPWQGIPIFTLPMGTRVPLVGSRKGFYRILLPVASGPRTWKEFYIPIRLASRGYLPFQENTLVEQAYSFLGEPYSWGGKNGVDCSLLVREVFATTGILLPRNSAQQAQVGTTIWRPSWGEDVKRVLEKAPLGRTLIFLPKHVMILAGKAGGEFQVLHSLYSWQGEKVERVVFTPLEPFLKRIVRITTIP